MTQIYIVMSQGSYLMGQKAIPIAAFSDYPTALAYAKTIFRPLLGSQETARDLVFLLNLSPISTSTTAASTK